MRQFTDKARSFITNAIDRRLHPESLIASDLTAYQVIHQQDLVSLRYYPPLTQPRIQVEDQSIPVEEHQHAVPILLVPPLGVSAWIFDMLQERSLVRYLLARGFKVYLVDWGQPTRVHSHVTLDNYATEWLPAVLTTLRQHGDSLEVSLLGYCMGGLISLTYASYFKDPHIKNLVALASPIDFYQAGVLGRAASLLGKPLQYLGRATNRSLYHVSPKKFHVSGAHVSRYFKLFNPLGNITSYIDLILNMADRSYVSRHTTMSRWFNDMLDFPGATMQHMFVNILGNQMVKKGYINLGSKKAKLKNITCSLLAIAGRGDKLATADAAKKLVELVGSADVAFKLVPGGHAGVFAGSSAPENTWQTAADWLAERSD